MRTLTKILCAAVSFASPQLSSLAAAHEFSFVGALSGPAESPPNASPGVGFAVVTIDEDLITLDVSASFSGLTGAVTGAHIHGATSVPGIGTAGFATSMLPGFTAGVMQGTYDETLDLAVAESYDPAFITASGGTVGDALNALIFSLEAGKTYFSIETTALPGGEIRGFLAPDPKADFNHDGVVGGEDLAIWLEAFNSTPEGDANNDEATDGVDFLIWQNQLGSFAEIPLVRSAGEAVPEPGAWVLALAAGLAAVQRKRTWLSRWLNQALILCGVSYRGATTACCPCGLTRRSWSPEVRR